MWNDTTVNLLAFFGSAFLLTGVLASKLSSKIRVPALVLYIAIGMLAGSEGPGGIAFADFALTKHVGTLLLAYILFAGGMDTQWDELRPVLWRGLALSTIGVVATAALVGLFAHAFLSLSPLEGLLLGSIVASTDAAAVFASLRGTGINLRYRISPLLEAESGTNDPIAVFLTAMLTEAIAQKTQPGWPVLLDLIREMPIGLVIGIAIAQGAVWLVNHLRLAHDGLYPVITFSAAGMAYGGAALAHGNAFISVYAAGVVLGSSNLRHKSSLFPFHEGVAWLFQIVVFLSLGLLAFPSQIVPTIGVGLGFAAFLILVARPLAVFLSLAFARFPAKAKLFVSWAGLRGAFPIILGTFPVLAGLPSGHFIFNLVFFVVVFSVVVQGTSLKFLAEKLGVNETVAA